MIDKNWFSFENVQVIEEVQEDDSHQIIIKSNNRDFDLNINKCDNSSIQTDIFLLENNIHLCSFASNRSLFSSDPIPIEKIKTVFAQWLVEQIDVHTLNAAYEEIEVLAIYPYYLKGEEGLKEYKWIELENRLYLRLQNKGSELLHLYKASAKLEEFTPYISLGRLCLGTEDKNGYPTLDFCCFYYQDDRYIVSDYDNTEKHRFDSPKEAIVFAEMQADKYIGLSLRV